MWQNVSQLGEKNNNKCIIMDNKLQKLGKSRSLAIFKVDQ